MNTISLHSSNSFQDSLYVVGVVLYTTDKGTATCRPRVAGEPFVWTDKTELKSKLRDPIGLSGLGPLTGQNTRNNTRHRHSVAPDRYLGWLRSCRLVAQSISLVVFYLFLFYFSLFFFFPQVFRIVEMLMRHFAYISMPSSSSSGSFWLCW